MKKKRNNGRRKNYLTLEDAIELIKATVDKVFATHKKEMDEYFRRRDEEMQAYLRKKDEEIAEIRRTNEEIKKSNEELREMNQKLAKRIEQTMESSEAAKRGIGVLVESMFENAPVQACIQLSNGKFKRTEIIKMTEYVIQIGPTSKTEVDVYARTPDYQIAVIAEIKNQVNKRDVKNFVKKLKDIVEEGSKYDGNIKLAKGIYGMIGGMRFKDDAREIALENGLIVATYSGEEVVLETPDKVRDWRKGGDKV